MLLSMVAFHEGFSTTKVRLSVRGSILSPVMVSVLVCVPTANVAGVRVNTVPATGGSD